MLLGLRSFVAIIALAGSPCTGYGRLKVWIMWQVSHSQCGREMLAFFSEWFGWMLHSWVPNNVLAFQRERGCFTSANALVNSLAWFFLRFRGYSKLFQ